MRKGEAAFWFGTSVSGRDHLACRVAKSLSCAAEQAVHWADFVSAMICRQVRGRRLNRPGVASDSFKNQHENPLEENSMREIACPLARALSLACSAVAIASLAIAMASLASGEVLAQAKQAPPKQMTPAQPAPPPPQQGAPLKQIALTEAQVQGVLSAAKEMDPITEKIPENAKPDPKVTAQLDGIAKKNGFANYDEYDTVVDNITLVLGGFDPATKKYVGAEAVIKAQIAQVQADKKIPAKDKKEALADLNDALKSPQPAIENKGNIDLVAKYYDKLAAVLGEDQQ
jgi:hypothetical protein